jgi:hypothetical protein
MQIRRSSAGKGIVLIGILWLFLIGSYAGADSAVGLSKGATVYVSIYSHLYAGPKAITYNLASMLSIRNTDPKFSITVTKADYYDSGGKLVKSYLKKSITLKPLESKHFYIQEYDESGGSGANFIVKWHARERVNKPIIEGIMTGLRSGQGVSFRCPGQEITEHDK